jgi:Ca-activated chloride channel homolog
MSRRAKTGVLVLLAVVISVACMAGLSAQAVVNRVSCTNNPVLVNVAVSDDITPAIQTIARAFNNQDHMADGRCAQVQVSEADSAGVVRQLDHQGAVPGLSRIDAWIPDSSLWIDVVRENALGAQAVQPTGITVATSPVMIVTTAAVTGKNFDEPLGWDVLLPPGYGGPPASLGLTVELPDPAESAVGLAATIEVSRQLGTSADATSEFTDFVNDSETTLDTDSAAALTNFVHDMASLGRRAVTVASEQAVLAYDKTSPSDPLVARYPSGPSSALGTPELDYPYVLTTAAPAEVKAATAFGKFLKTPYAQSAVRYYGFRSASGVPGSMPSSDGLSSQPLQLATPFNATQTVRTLEVWQKLSLGSRDLVLTDVSPAMNAPDGLPNQSIEEEVALTSLGGLRLFPKSTHMGQWIMGQSKTKPYEQLVSLGGLTADVGLITRLQQLYAIDKTLRTFNGTLLLHDAILAAYKDMTKSYAPNDVNAVLVLTAGVDGPHDMPLSQLLSQLKALYNPNRKVEIVALMFGRSGNYKANFSALQQIADATGGVAYEVASPVQVKKIFIEAWSHRLCNQGCVAP